MLNRHENKYGKDSISNNELSFISQYLLKMLKNQKYTNLNFTINFNVYIVFFLNLNISLSLVKYNLLIFLHSIDYFKFLYT